MFTITLTSPIALFGNYFPDQISDPEIMILPEVFWMQVSIPVPCQIHTDVKRKEQSYLL